MILSAGSTETGAFRLEREHRMVRICAVDASGAKRYSEVFRIHFAGAVQCWKIQRVSREKLVAETFLLNEENAHINIVNAMGRVVVSGIYDIVPGKGLLTVSLPSLPGGTYFLYCAEKGWSLPFVYGL